MEDFTFKKSLGQNFIFDENLLASVISKLDLQKTDTVLEIGTGAGTLTTVLARHVHRVITFEVDPRLQPLLAEKFPTSSTYFTHQAEHWDSPFNERGGSCEVTDGVCLIFADIMKTPDSKLTQLTNGETFKLIANIPYYITSPLLLRFIRNPACREICVLVQQEVANRITATPNTKDYGALSVTMQLAANCKLIKRIPRTAFKPQPKVDSAFIKCTKPPAKPTPPIENLAHFDTLIKGLFSARRKTILNALCTHYKNTPRQTIAQILTTLNINPVARPETLTPSQFAALANASDKTL